MAKIVSCFTVDCKNWMDDGDTSTKSSGDCQLDSIVVGSNGECDDYE